MNLWYHVGSRNEKRGKTGFAHLFEHFFFNGSENYPHGFREAMDDLGANNRNGTTSFDRTNFFEDVPTSALERTLYLEADRMGFLAKQINQAMLERERGVVQNEKRQGENQPYGRVFDHMVERMYPASHPYSWSTIGSMEDLNAARLADVQEWYRAYYGPNNCVISLAGDITPDARARAREEIFRRHSAERAAHAGRPLGAPARRAYARGDAGARAADAHPQASITRRPGATPISSRSTCSPACSRGRAARGWIAGWSTSRSSRRRVTAGVAPSEIASLVVVTVTVKTGVDPAKAEAEMDRIVTDLVQHGPTEAELQRARSRIMSDFARGAERLGGFGGRSDILAESMTFDGAPDGYLARLERIARTTAAEVRAASRQLARRAALHAPGIPGPATCGGADHRRSPRTAGAR